MRAITLLSVVLAITLIASAANSEPKTSKGGKQISNAAIDYAGFLKLAQEVADYRAERRVTENEFLEMSKEEGTIVLDTRSAAAFAQLHVAGAVHLNFSDITKERLVKVIPDPETRILIYCNNNFQNRPVAFAEKRASAALNIPTFITLYEYGYRNVYELGPIIDADKTKLELVSTKDEMR